MTAPKKPVVTLVPPDAEAPRAEGPAPNVVVALSRVMRDLPGIGKDQAASAAQGGYRYRGIEAITREVAPLFAKHGVVFVPRVHEWFEPREFLVNNKPWTDERLLVTYTVYGPGGPQDNITVGPIPAIGRDNSDKAGNKCLTQAYKYALLQTLCIADAKDDADGETWERDEPAATHTSDGEPYADREQVRQVLAQVRSAPDVLRHAMNAWWKEEQLALPLTESELGRLTEKYAELAVAEPVATEDGEAGAQPAGDTAPSEVLPPSGDGPVDSPTQAPTGGDTAEGSSLALDVPLSVPAASAPEEPSETDPLSTKGDWTRLGARAREAHMVDAGRHGLYQVLTHGAGSSAKDLTKSQVTHALDAMSLIADGFLKVEYQDEAGVEVDSRAEGAAPALLATLPEEYELGDADPANTPGMKFLARFA